jgi:hypothetical protein
MNKLSLLALGMLMLVTACKKTDLLPAPNTPAASATATTAAAPSWNSLSSWQATTFDKGVMYSNTISDTLITASVVKNGLVLGYAKTEAGVFGLPYQQTQNADTYSWFYQVRAGAIVVSCTTSAAAKAPSVSQTFAYLVFTPEKLAALQSKGQTKASIIGLSYDKASALLP